MRNRNGITLIALIITVIIMLILAGVALSSISGEAGLFSRVQKTAELYNNSANAEQSAINNIIAALNGDYNNDEYAKIYGVKREISSESSAWTRIEDSIGLEAKATHDGSTEKNDFDNIYPWSEIKTCDLKADGTVNKYYYEDGFSYESPEGYIMTEFPEFWWKREQKDDGYEYVYISATEHEGFTKSEKFYLGRYTVGGDLDALTTKSGDANLGNITLPELRTAAQEIGTNWGQLDITRWSMLQLLYLVEYADYNSQAILGNGNVNADAILNTGTCNTLEMKSGCLENDGKHAVVYRGIENIYGNIHQFCDGINLDYTQAWISSNINEYTSDKFDAPYSKLAYQPLYAGKTAKYIKEVGYDENNPAIQLPKDVEGSNSTYVTDDFYIVSSSVNHIMMLGGQYNYNLACGLWHYEWDWNSNSKNANVGGRIQYIPS